jgi:hypothetical protein
VGSVAVGGTVLRGWDIYSIPLETVPSVPKLASNNSSVTQQTPMFYGAHFALPSNACCNAPATLDTFLAIPNGIKGQAFVNGFNLGRYWLVGPQQSLYLPGGWLKCNETNEVVVLELEPSLVNGTMTAVGPS